MKLMIILLLAAVLISMFGLPFEEYATEQLLPVKTIQVERLNGLVHIVTEVGKGIGESWSKAVQDLREQAAGKVFFDTAEHIVFCGSAETVVSEALESEELRPSTQVYYADSLSDPETLGSWLEAHESGSTLADLREGQ